MILYAFSKNNCAPCARLKPELALITADLAVLDIPTRAINIDEEDASALLTQYGIRSVPALILADDDGTARDQFLGSGVTRAAVLRSVAIERIVDEVKHPKEDA